MDLSSPHKFISVLLIALTAFAEMADAQVEVPEGFTPEVLQAGHPILRTSDVVRLFLTSSDLATNSSWQALQLKAQRMESAARIVSGEAVGRLRRRL